MSAIRPGSCADPGPGDAHCTEDRGHRWSCYDAGEDVSWNDGQFEMGFFDSPDGGPVHQCDEAGCPGRSAEGEAAQAHQVQQGSGSDHAPPRELPLEVPSTPAHVVGPLASEPAQLSPPLEEPEALRRLAVVVEPHAGLDVAVPEVAEGRAHLGEGAEKHQHRDQVVHLTDPAPTSPPAICATPRLWEGDQA